MLPNVVHKLMPTPTATEYGRQKSLSDGASIRPSLNTLARTADRKQYEPAIRRWEDVLGIPAPEPSVRGPRGGIKVSPHFAEWLMGIPGRITAVPGLSVNAQLKLAGNGVVPQQAELAIRQLLENLAATAEDDAA